MSTAPTTAALTHNPDPASGHASAQSRAGRVLGLLRKLIDYGQELARTVQQHAAASSILLIAMQFGTRDIARILARITRALQLANALETKILSRPARPDTVPTTVRTPADRTPRPARPAERRPPLPDIPTEEDIAAALRHRSATAVIADICRDLGIVPAHPLWQEVMLVLTEHGNSFGKFVKDVTKRVCTWLTDRSADDSYTGLMSHAQPVAAAGTGPP